MPGLVAPVADEREALLAFLAQQRSGLRYATHALSDEAATARPSASELCLAGLVKHAALTERHWMASFVEAGETSGFLPSAARDETFVLTNDETLRDVLDLYETVAGETERIVGAISDLGADLTPTPPGVPWITEGLVWSPRWVLLHLIEETARHAGHADIIRESIDGATCWTLMAAAEGTRVDGGE